MDLMNRYAMRMNEEGGAEGVTAGAAAPEGGALATPVEAAPIIPANESADIPSIYGDLKVNWPDAMDQELMNEPMLKPFINKETGNVEMANLLKSYSHTKKMVGSNKVTLPTENSTDLEKTEFWEKLGFIRDEAEYKMDAGEETLLDEAFVGDLKKFARENHMPLDTAKKMVEFMEVQSKIGNERETAGSTETIAEGLNSLKTEYGMAYDSNLTLAKRVLNEVVEDPSVMEAMKDPSVGSNPAVIKALVAIGKKVFAEDGLKGNQNSGMVSPDDASRKVNEMMADKAGAYWNKSHPDHTRTVAEALKLREMMSPQVR